MVLLRGALLASRAELPFWSWPRWNNAAAAAAAIHRHCGVVKRRRGGRPVSQNRRFFGRPPAVEEPQRQVSAFGCTPVAAFCRSPVAAVGCFPVAAFLSLDGGNSRLEGPGCEVGAFLCVCGRGGHSTWPMVQV